MSDYAEFSDMPIDSAMAVCKKFLQNGWAKDIKLWSTSGKPARFQDILFIKTDPPIVAPHLAEKMRHYLFQKVLCVPDAGTAAKIAAEKDVLWQGEPDLSRMADGHIELPKLFRMRCSEAKPYEIENDGCPQLIVSREYNDMAVLSLKNGKIFAKMTAEPNDWPHDRLSLDWNSIPCEGKSLLRWLKGFLPSSEILEKFFISRGKDCPDPEIEAGLFEILSVFGNFFCGSIRFRVPLSNRVIDNSRGYTEYKGKKSCAMPEYAGEIDFPKVIFPGQIHGFALDCDLGIWQGRKKSAHYFIPEMRDNILQRFFSLFIAEIWNIPCVEIKYVTKNSLRGMALRRFDLLGGESVWRQNFLSLERPEKALSFLSRQEKRNMLKLFWMGEILGFNGLDLVIIEPLPDFYDGNVSGAEDILLLEEEKDYSNMMLAPFSGARCGNFSEIGRIADIARSYNHYSGKDAEVREMLEITDCEARDLWSALPLLDQELVTLTLKKYGIKNG